MAKVVVLVIVVVVVVEVMMGDSGCRSSDFCGGNVDNNGDGGGDDRDGIGSWWCWLKLRLYLPVFICLLLTDSMW